jgi:hypothetical protein
MLGEAKGRDQFIQFALKATDEESANFIQNMAELLRGYHEGVAPIREIKLVAGYIVAQAGNQAVVVPFPLDYGVWTSTGEAVAKEVKAKAQQAGLNGKLELWVTGTLSARAKAGFSAMGIGVVEKVVQRFEFQY